MPKSRTRTNTGRKSPLTKASKERIDAAYLKKFQEFEAMELEDLIFLQKTRTQKGTYLVALTSVIEMKERKSRQSNNEQSTNQTV